MAKLKRLNAPIFWEVSKKETKLVVSPRPGPHKKFECIPLAIVLRNKLKIAETAKDAKDILNTRDVLIDGKIRKDIKYPAGLMDVIAFPKIKKYYRIVPVSRGLDIIEIAEKEAKLKLFRIDDKKILRKGKVQLNLHDGKNIIVGKDVYKTGDSLLLEMPGLKIIDHEKLEAGKLGIIIKGKNSGKIVKIKKVLVTKTREPNKIICEMDNEEVESIQKYIFVVGKDKPLIKVSE